LPDASVDLCLADTPYQVTNCSWDTMIDLDAWWRQMRRVMKPNGAVVMTASQPYTSVLVCSNFKWFRYEWIWDKRVITGWLDAKRKPLKRHESVLVFAPAAAPYYPQMTAGDPYRVVRAGATEVYSKHQRDELSEYGGERYPTSIIDQFGHQPVKNVHPSQKSLDLFEYLIRTYTQPGALVFDPFVGSGTTALAARNTGRHFITGDLSAEYVEIARARLAEPYTPDMFDTLPQPDAGPQQLSIFEEVA